MNEARRRLTAALLFATAAPLAAAVALMVPTLTAFAQSPRSAAPSAQAQPNSIDGEVRKIDKDARKITLRHAEIKELDMPAMTMVFQVKDPSLLDKVKTGDKVKFKAEGSGGTFVLTEIEVAK